MEAGLWIKSSGMCFYSNFSNFTKAIPVAMSAHVQYELYTPVMCLVPQVLRKLKTSNHQPFKACDRVSHALVRFVCLYSLCDSLKSLQARTQPFAMNNVEGSIMQA